jgi:hypothetical protein
MVFTPLKKIVMSLLISMLLGGGLLFYFAQGIEKVSLEKFELTGLRSIDSDSFTLTGNIYMDNPSRMTIPVHSVKYELILNDTGEVISEGRLAGFRLKSGDTEVPFEQEIIWVPSGKLILEMILKEHVYANVRGVIAIEVPFLEPQELRFSKDIDLKEHLRNLARDKANGQNGTGSLPIRALFD